MPNPIYQEVPDQPGLVFALDPVIGVPGLFVKDEHGQFVGTVFEIIDNRLQLRGLSPQAQAISGLAVDADGKAIIS